MKLLSLLIEYPDGVPTGYFKIPVITNAFGSLFLFSTNFQEIYNYAYVAV